MPENNNNNNQVIKFHTWQYNHDKTGPFINERLDFQKHSSAQHAHARMINVIVEKVQT